MRRVALASLSVFTLLLALPLAAGEGRAQSLDDPKLRVELVALGLDLPTSLGFIGLDDILVAQKNDGKVRRILNGVLQPGAVLDVAVDASNERGLLGMAIDPDFPINHHVYLYYTESAIGVDTNGDPDPIANRVYHYTWDGSALLDPVLVASLPAVPGPNHDGGVITFGPDGALYAVIGDLTRAGRLQNVPNGSGPDDTGVILRLDARGAGPSDNPFFNAQNPADPMNRYYAYGVRNSFGLAFDPKTGFLWDTENGDLSYDEVNRVVRGMNSGWNAIMGPDARDPQGLSDLWVAPGSVYRDPEFSWAVPVAPTSIVFPVSPILGCGLTHEVLVADNNCGQIYHFKLNATRDALQFASAELSDRVADNPSLRCSEEMDEIRLGGGFSVVTDMENGPDGRLYVVALNYGMVFRFAPNPGTFPDADGDLVADTCDCATSDPGSFAAPGEVPHARVSAMVPQAISWDGQGAAAGFGTTYTLVTGDLAALHANHGYAAACTLAQGLGATPFVDPRSDPAVGAGYFYLLRAENACGAGTFGNGTPLPDPRDALDATLPAACAPATP